MSASSKGGLYAVCGSFIALSVSSTSIRFMARKYHKMFLGWDDWTALFGVMTYIAAAAIAMHFAAWDVAGYGKPTPEQTAAKAKNFVRLAYTYDFLNVNTLACAKLSALFLYKRVFVMKHHRCFNTVIRATIVMIILWYVTSDFLSLYQCPGHFAAAWDGQFTQYCILNPVWAKELAMTDFILDLWVLVLPIVPILKLHTTTAKKLSIIGVFLLAFVGLGASIVRIVYFFRAKGSSSVVAFIAMLEEGISVTVINLPAIYLSYKSVIPKRVAASLHSIGSFASNASIAGRSRFEATGGIKEDEQNAATVKTSAV